MLVKLSNSDFLVFEPEIDFFINKINNKEYFKFVKLNHSYWQVRIKENPWYELAVKIHGEEFLLELDQIIRVPLPDDFIFGVGVEPDKNPLRLVKEIKSIVPKRDMFVGKIWKTYVCQGVINYFIQHIRKMPIVVVGFKHLENLKNVWHIKDFNFVELDLLTAPPDRYIILEKLQKIGQEGEKMFLFQAGEWLSFWFIYHLKDLPSVYCVDMGRALDVWVDYKLTNKNKVIDILIPDWKKQVWDANIERDKLQYNLWLHLLKTIRMV